MNSPLKIYIPNETTSNSVGATQAYKAISNLKGIEEAEIIRNGTWGAFWLEPFIEVESEGNRVGVCYKGVDLSQLKTLNDFLSDFDNRDPFDIRKIEFINEQKRIVFSRIGKGDPLDILFYQDQGGYDSLKTALNLNQQNVIDKIKESGLT